MFSIPSFTNVLGPKVSDDEDDTHPNIDTPSLFRWRHQARVERMEQQQHERTQFDEENKEHKKKVQEVTKKMKDMEKKDTVSGACYWGWSLLGVALHQRVEDGGQASI